MELRLKLVLEVLVQRHPLVVAQLLMLVAEVLVVMLRVD